MNRPVSHYTQQTNKKQNGAKMISEERKKRSSSIEFIQGE